MLITAILLCVLCIVPVAMAEDERTPVTTETTLFVPVTAPVTEEPTPFHPVTAPVTEEPTIVPTKEKTMEPTVIPITVVTTRETIAPPLSVGGGKGWIDTYCNVDGAAVYFDGSPQGQIAGGILSVGVSPTGTPIHTITVSKSGYLSWEGTLPEMPEDGEHVAVYATINPVPTQTTVPPVQNGAIYAQSVPNGASIYMNGLCYGTAPLTIPNVPAGTYSMKAMLNGYSTDSQMIIVYAGQTAYYSPVLQQSPQPQRNTGSVYITSSPDHAAIYIDGNYYGKAPMTVTLYPGTHSLVLRLSGYDDYSTSVYVNAGQTQSLPVTMSPAIYGSVLITSLPGASVAMDSVPLGTVGPSGTYNIASVTSGNHLFKVTAAGYNDWMNTVYIQPNYQTRITATLTPKGASPTPVPVNGGLNIVSAPSGADIFVDNLFRGYTPATMTDITPGQHTVLLKYTGYIDYTTTVTVSSGQTTPLAVTMTAAPVPTQKSALSMALLIVGLAGMIGISAVLKRRM